MIIYNIKNLYDAKKYWAVSLIADKSEVAMLHKRIDGKRFLFWPKVLKGVGILSIIIGVIISIRGLVPAFKILAELSYPTAKDVLVHIYYSTVILFFGFSIALGSFASYYLFRFLLHRMQIKYTTNSVIPRAARLIQAGGLWCMVA